VKVQGSVTKTQSLKGTISKAELLALVRETFAIPGNAKARFYAHTDVASFTLTQFPGCAPAHTDITESSPLRFVIDWELPDAEKQG
jgi:hypothetical protein